MKIVSCFLVVLLVLSSCGPKAVYEGSYDFKDRSWGSGESPSFSYSSTSTTDAYNFIVTLRTTTDYEYSNLWVFMYTKNPNGDLRKDTLNFPLAEQNGKWLGKKTGSLIEHELLIGWNTRFPEKGEYQIRFEQAIPDPEVKHVSDISLRIMPVDEK